MTMTSTKGALRGALAVAGLCCGLAIAGAPAAQAGDITFNGRMYFDFTNKQNKDEKTGIKTSDSGIGVDVKRFYAQVNYKLDDRWSATFVSDIGDQGARRYDVFVKKAYIQGHFSDFANLRLGSADTAWIPFVEDTYGYRYVEQTITDHLSFGTSADWGVHFYGRAGIVGYQFSAENGKGYSNPSRTKTVDFEGRVSVEPVQGLRLAVGGYSGKLGNETASNNPAKHTANRTDALVAYSNPHFRVGGEWFEAKNWKNVTTVATDKADGWSTWVAVPLTPQYELFARYDSANPSKDLKPNLEFTYYNAGVQYTFNSVLLGSLVYKHADVKGGTLGTGNGTIGSVDATRKGKYDELGVFLQFRM